MNDILVFVEYFQGMVSDISYVCLAQARSIEEATGGKVRAVLAGKGVGNLSGDLLADEVIHIDHEALAHFTCEPFVDALSQIIRQEKPSLVLMGDTSFGSDVAGCLSARLELPLVSFCKEICVDGGKLSFVSEICGGKIFAEGDLPQDTCLVTMLPGRFKAAQGRAETAPPLSKFNYQPEIESRVRFKEMVMPSEEDLDISQEEVLVAIGRGIDNEDNVELAGELAEAMGGVLCASRPVIDQGWLQTTRLVGKSGKKVKPRLYLALGISGAPEHVEAIEDSEMIIAVNTDPAAPIFNIARYGIVEDLMDVSEELLISMQEIKGG